MNRATSTQTPWYKDLKVYREPRVWIIFVFGMMSGLPWVLIGSMLSAWLQESGVERASIGLFGLVFASYSINALWSPLIDRVAPPLSSWLGMRRSWMLCCTIGLLLATFALSQLSATDQLWFIALVGVMIGFFSATQDIAIDAFRIESFSLSESRLQSAGAAMATAGWWTGYSGLGVLPFYLVGGSSGWLWQDAYLLMTALLGLQLLFILCVREPTRFSAASAINNTKQSWAATLSATVIQPVREFFQRNGNRLALAMLVFIFIFKIGEAFLGRMSIVFYKEIGFTNQDIAIYSKMVTWWVTIIFAILGSIVNLRLGIVRGLMIGGIAMASSNLMFAWIAQVGPNTDLLLAAVIIDGFTGAWSTVAFVAFISLLCSRTFTATQYALLASLGNLARTTLSSYSGYVVDWLQGDWSLFFILTALMVIPSLLILFWLRRPLGQLEQAYHNQREQA